MSDLYRELQKAELHLHLEGSVEPETVLELDPSLTLDHVREKYAHTDFEGFIQSYVWINRLLRSPSDYALILRRLLESLDSQNVVYAEINLSAGVMLWKGQNADAIFEALREQASQSPVQICWIFDAVRQFGTEPAMDVARLAVKYRDAGVVGFGIGGDERRGPAEMFADVFAFAKNKGLTILPHAGETVGSESIWAAIQGGARRIGHGIRAADDPKLLDYLQEKDIPLEVCISSNVCTGSVPSLEAHPVRRLYDAGVPITLNSDDPGMFRTTLSNEYRIAAERFGFSETELRSIAGNAFRYALGYFQGAR